MFAASPFATLAFAEKATYLVDGAGSMQGAAACQGRGQTMRDGAASTVSVAALLARSNPWHNADMWAQAYANAAMAASVVLDVDMLAQGHAATSLQAGYTLPTGFEANGQGGFAGHGIQVVHGVLAAAGFGSMQATGYAARQAAGRAIGAGQMYASGARKVGAGLFANGVATFRLYSVTTDPGEAIWDAAGRASAVFHMDAVHDALWSLGGSSAFHAAGQAFGQALMQAQGAGMVQAHGHSYASMYSVMPGVGRAQFMGLRAGFNMADLMAGGDSWTNLRTATARNGGAYMAGVASAAFVTEYAAAIMASMFATGKASAQVDGFRRIFVMGDASAYGGCAIDIRAHAYASSDLNAPGLAQLDAHGTAVRSVNAHMPGASYLKWNVGNPIFQFLPPAYDTVIRHYEVRGIERPFEQRKVNRP